MRDSQELPFEFLRSLLSDFKKSKGLKFELFQINLEKDLNSDLTYESFLDNFLKENKKALKNKKFDHTINIFLVENHFLNPILKTSHFEKDIFLTLESDLEKRGLKEKDKIKKETENKAHIKVTTSDFKRALEVIFINSEMFKSFFHPSHQLERGLLKGVYELKGYDPLSLLETEIFREVYFYLKLYKIELSSFFKKIEKDHTYLMRVWKLFKLNESEIFKKEEEFDYIEKVIYPEVFKDYKKGEKIRVWIVGFGTGQEFFNYFLPFINYCKKNNFLSNNNIQFAATELIGFEDSFGVAPYLKESDYLRIPKKYRIFLAKNEEGKYTLFKNIGVNYFISDRNNFINSLGFFNTDLIVLNNLFTPYKDYYIKKIFEKASSRLKDGGIILSDELSKNSSGLQKIMKKVTWLKDNNSTLKGLIFKKNESSIGEFQTIDKNSIEEIQDSLNRNQAKFQKGRERIQEAQRVIERYKVYPNDPVGSALKIKKELMETAGYIDLKKENEELRETLRSLEKSYALTYKVQLINYKKMEEANLKLEDMKNNLVKNLINKTEELEKLNKVLSQFEKDRTSFYSKLSHDLRTPLNSVLGFSDVAMEGINDLESEQIFEYLSYINKSGKSLLNLVNSIYEFTKVDLEKLKIVDENFSTQQFLDELQALHENNCVIKGLRFELNKGSNLPTYLKADQSKMRQVLDNLIDNAVKFTDEGLVSLDVQAYYYAGKEDQFDLVFEVSDTGKGIETDKTKQIEKEFSNPLEEGNLGEKGSGIGLYVSKKIVEKMNGEIEISSKKGKGTLFTVVFKDVYKGESEVFEDDSLSTNFLGQEVIILDKSQSGRILLMTYLDGTNLKIETAQNQKELYQKVKRTNPSLILCDVSLPMEEKLESILEIKEDEKYKDIPIILLSSVSISEDVSINFQGILQKPLSKKFLLNEFKKHLKFESLSKEQAGETSKKIEESKEFLKETDEKTSINKIGLFPVIKDIYFNKEEVKLIKHLVIDLTYFLKYMDINVLEEKLLSYKNSIEETKLSHTKEWVESVMTLSNQFEVDQLKKEIEGAVKKLESYILKEAKASTNRKAS